MTAPAEIVVERHGEPPRHASPLLNRRGAVRAAGPDDGVAWHYGDPTAEQRALSRGGAVVDQSYLGVVTVTGPDRLTWLNSITSQELTTLAPRTSTELLVLSPQGHIEHAAGVVDDGATTWLLTETPIALAAWLNRMKFMLRVEIADVTDDWAAIGEPVDAEGEPDEPVTWRDPWPTTARGRHALRARRRRAPGRRPRLADRPGPARPAGRGGHGSRGGRLAPGRHLGQRGDARRGVAAAASHEVDHRTIPHELDWLRTAVHLHKGCYRGQESVARVHNLGRPPRRIVMLHLDGSGHVLPEVGAQVHDVVRTETSQEPGRPVGSVTTVARHHELGPVALAVVKRSTPVDAELVVDSDGGAVAVNQEAIVPGEGVSNDRPAPRGPVARGLGQHPML